jgi:pimeloyl-ACP methyl ester carboxylesterase
MAKILVKVNGLSADQPPIRRLNVRLPTLGGRQFWADELFLHDWHIQRNVFTGHYRLLSGAGVRHAWGTFDQCRARLDDIKRQRNFPPMQGPAVVVLHGLFRTRASMRRMSRFLREAGGYSVFNVAYPTTRAPLAHHAQALAKLIRNLDGIDEINFVAHSLGNLVIRHYLGDSTDAERGITPDPRIKRFVMLGPPNHGAQLAVALGRTRLFGWIAGASAGQLGRDWAEVSTRLVTPCCQFGIIAGGRGTRHGFNPALGQDNDMVVSVETTQLAGAHDSAIVSVPHTLLMDNANVRQYTLRFLQHGHFVSESERRPLPFAPMKTDDRATGLNAPEKQ